MIEEGVRPSQETSDLQSGNKKTKKPDLEDNSIGICGGIFYFIVVIFLIPIFPIAIFMAIRVVRVYERAVVLRYGKLRKFNGQTVLGAGLQCVMPCVEEIIKIDLRTQVIDIPRQEVLTSDAVTVTVDAVVFMKVVEPASALLLVQDAKRSSKLLAISSLRKVIGSYDLTQVLTNRDDIHETITKILDEATDEWGVKVERVEIKDVKLPIDMQRAMAAEAQAQRAAKAKIISAKGELEAASTLSQAATEMGKSPAALQLRYLQTLTTIAAEQNSTIIFPLPIDLLQNFFSKKGN